MIDVGCSYYVREPEVTFLPFFLFINAATTEIYTLSLHDALPILASAERDAQAARLRAQHWTYQQIADELRSEEHTSELQSRPQLVCRLLLEKKIIFTFGCAAACRMYRFLCRTFLGATFLAKSRR